MQRKIIIDTNIYIDIFNSGRYLYLRDPFQFIVFLAYPVLHELWMGVKGTREKTHLTAFQNEFIKLKRLILPQVSTLVSIVQACQNLRAKGRLDPIYPKHYNDISIAALARQIGATVITKNTRDFKMIQNVIDFDFDKP